MCNCLFCGQEMEAEENIDNSHICPPDENISLQSVRVAMNEIFEKEADGWDAWAQLVEWLSKQSAQHSVNPTSESSDDLARKQHWHNGRIISPTISGLRKPLASTERKITWKKK